MSRRGNLPLGAYCARCDRDFESAHKYRFDVTLGWLAVCRTSCTGMPYAQGPKPVDVAGRFLTRGPDALSA